MINLTKATSRFEIISCIVMTPICKDFNGKSDPYVVLYHGDNKAKSKTFKKDLNPNFEFTGNIISSMASKSIHICWISTGSQLY